MKKDAGKPRLDLVDPDAVEEMARVLGWAAEKKYRPNGWKEGGGIEWRRILRACLSHTFAMMRGELRDPESGFLHAAHLMCNGMFLCHYMLHPSKYGAGDR